MGGLGYFHALERIESFIELNQTLEEKLDFIDFIMKAIRLDLQTEVLTSLLYDTQKANLPQYRLPFPYEVDVDSEIMNLYNSEKIKIDFSETITISQAFENKKFVRAMHNIATNGFKPNSSNTLATYYKCLDICIIENGYHHTAIAILNRQGSIHSHYYDTSKIFPIIDVDIDGNFYYVSNNEILCPYKSDKKLALLYKLAKQKWIIRQNTDRIDE